MADKVDKVDKKDLLFGKYETMEEAEKGIAELHKKFGDQSKQLGELRKQAEAQQAYLQQATPILQWYQQNYQGIQQMMTQPQRQAQPQAQAYGYNGQPGAYPGAAYGHAQGQPANGQAAGAQAALMNLLTPEEQRALAEQVSRQVQETAIAPWQQQFGKQVETALLGRAKQVEDALLNHQKSFSDVLWKTLERALPPDKIAEMRDWHTEALKYADPRNIDPMEVANQQLEMRKKLADYEARTKEYETKLAEREKQDAAMLTGTRPFTLSSSSAKADAPPPSREDRMGSVLQTIKSEHGTEGVQSLFNGR